MGKEDRRESFLNDLGRATRRGVRECRKCGTLNGTRGYSCKNKSCDVVFKEAGEKKKLSTEACKIITGDGSQIYSVRVRDKGPDYRGFVQLDYQNQDNRKGCSPSSNIFSLTSSSYSGTSTSTINTSSIMDEFDGKNPLSSLTDSNLDCIKDSGLLLSPQQSVSSKAGRNFLQRPANSSAYCFVDSCHKGNKNVEMGAPRVMCSHIKAASHCFKNSQSVMLKSSVLNSMNIPPDLKSAIWHLAIDSRAPLVQRVSKNILVVKCEVDTQHPLGFLHFSFHSSRSCHRLGADHRKYFCSCRAFRTSSMLLKETRPGGVSVPLRSCIHLYSCLIALASHPDLAAEFSHYINLITHDGATPSRDELRGALGAMDEDDGSDTVKIHVTEDLNDDTTAYIRVSDPGSCGADDLVSAERSFLILNDSGDQHCQVEVEVLQDDGTDHMLQEDGTDHLLQEDGTDHLLQDDSLMQDHAADHLLQALDRHHRNARRANLDAQDELDDKLEIQLRTSEDGGMELCTSDGGSITVHPCVTSSHHHHHHHHHHQQEQLQQNHRIAISRNDSSNASLLSSSCLKAVSGSLCDTGLTASFTSHCNSVDNEELMQHKNHCGSAQCVSGHCGNTNCGAPIYTKSSQAIVSKTLPNLNLQNINSDITKKKFGFGNFPRKARGAVDEAACSLPFLTWLASAAERINQAMQYANSGKPPPLVFHVPLDFFVCLFERIQQHSRKKLTAVQTSVPHNDPSVLTRQTRYTWNLFNLTHVKNVFSTPEVPLQVTRSFLLNRNGTYQYYEPSLETQNLPTSRSSSSQPFIKPQEYRTVIKVGPSLNIPSAKPSPFVIEWIPDVLPLSKIGELRIKFEYEHIHNGQVVRNSGFKEELNLGSINNSLASNLFQQSILINGSVNNNSSVSNVSSVKSLPGVKTSPPPIAPKININTHVKESSFDEQSAAILGIALSHDALVDADSYSALLFS